MGLLLALLQTKASQEVRPSHPPTHLVREERQLEPGSDVPSDLPQVAAAAGDRRQRGAVQAAQRVQQQRPGQLCGGGRRGGGQRGGPAQQASDQRGSRGLAIGRAGAIVQCSQAATCAHLGGQAELRGVSGAQRRHLVVRRLHGEALEAGGQAAAAEWGGRGRRRVRARCRCAAGKAAAWWYAA